MKDCSKTVWELEDEKYRIEYASRIRKDIVEVRMACVKGTIYEFSSDLASMAPYSVWQTR